MSKHYRASIILLACVSFFACKKENPSVDKTVPTTSPGKYLLFDENFAYNSGAQATPSIYTAIYYSNLDGTGLTQLTSPPAHEWDYRASFSPDGKQVIFVRDDSDDYPDTVRSIRIVNMPGGTPKTVAKGNNIDFPSFSPDGTQVVYAKGINDFVPYNYEMYIANADGSDEKKITTFSEAGDVFYMHWSKDGKIYFNTSGNNLTTGTYSINSDGTNMHFIIAGGLMGVSPDGKYLLYQTSKGLFYCNTDGSSPKAILSFTGQDNIGNPAGAAFTEDQKQVYFYYYNSITKLQGIYKINIDGTNLTQVLNGYYEVPSIY
jgi:Tol biopolymer transport system component